MSLCEETDISKKQERPERGTADFIANKGQERRRQGWEERRACQKMKRGSAQNIQVAFWSKHVFCARPVNFRLTCLRRKFSSWLSHIKSSPDLFLSAGRRVVRAVVWCALTSQVFWAAGTDGKAEERWAGTRDSHQSGEGSLILHRATHWINKRVRLPTLVNRSYCINPKPSLLNKLKKKSLASVLKSIDICILKFNK